MERLTEKVNDYWKTNDKAHIYYLDTNESVFIGNVIDRLAEFEDFMESLGLEELEELEHLIGYPRFVDGYDKNDNEINKVEFVTYKESFNEVLEQNKKLKQENQALKDGWQKLKKLLEEDMEHNSKEYDDSFCSAFQHYSATENWVLDRMEELEKE